MKAYRSSIWATAALSLLTLAAGCGDDGGGGGDTTPDAKPPDNTPDANIPSGGVVRVEADIMADTTWTADKIYVLPTYKSTFIKNNAKLTIQPGTVIQGEQASVLVITRGAKIIAEGTKDKPIVFTSNQDANRKTKGFWGGVLILGKARINNNHIANLPQSDEA